MRRFFLTTAIILSATAAHAGLDLAGPDTRVSEATQSSQTERPDAGASKREAMMQQKTAMRKQMMMQKQMAMQREMQQHPIRTRFHFAVLRFKQKMHSAFR